MRILSKLLTLDNLMVAVQFRTAVEGQFVILQIRLLRSFTFITIRMKVTTWRSLFRKLQKVNSEINSFESGEKV